MQILTGSASAETMNLEERSISRLLRQLRTLSPHADWLIIDTGNQVSELAARLWSITDQLLLVTAADAVAVMDTYALVKTLHSRKALLQSPSLVVNNIDDHAVAVDVHRRIDQSCRRFLDLSMAFAGCLPSDPSATAADQTSKGPLADGIARLCKQLLDSRHVASQALWAA
jgi:flagellar biosynthesis protein FlhG